MNRDSDITNEILLRLLFEPPTADLPPSGETVGSASTLSPLIDIYADLTPIFDPGDISAVQTHFEVLLKRRLTQEIAHRPPLFPWEKGLQDYPDALNHDASSRSIWLDHLQNLELPTGIPEDVLIDLLNQCQRVAQQTLQTGRRLVNAVEALFPDQTQTLEAIAGLVMRPAYRSAQAPVLEAIDYAAASPQQQIALSMMAAQSIFQALSLNVAADQPTVQRDWLTAAGPLTLQASYRLGQAPKLEVTVALPAAGSLVLASGTDTLRSERSTPGGLIVQLDSPQAGVPYTLEIQLTAQQGPLKFQITVDDHGAGLG